MCYDTTIVNATVYLLSLFAKFTTYHSMMEPAAPHTYKPMNPNTTEAGRNWQKHLPKQVVERLLTRRA